MQQLDVRSRGALEIVTSGQLANRVKLPNGMELVPSQSTEGAFFVAGEGSCTCPDARYRNVVCKHSLAIRILNLLEQANPTEEPQF